VVLKAYTGITGLIRDFTTGTTYPYTGENVSITGGWLTAASTSYYFFYNLNFSSGCASARTAVVATVNSAPALTLSSTSFALCAGQTSTVVNVTSNHANFDAYVWSPSTGVSGNLATGYTFNPSVSTVYTLSASQTGGSQ